MMPYVFSNSCKPGISVATLQAVFSFINFLMLTGLTKDPAGNPLTLKNKILCQLL
jgi:hypothetical protein